MSSSAESGLSHTHILGKPMFSLLLQATWTHPSNSFVVCLNNHAHAKKIHHPGSGKLGQLFRPYLAQPTDLFKGPSGTGIDKLEQGTREGIGQSLFP